MRKRRRGGIAVLVSDIDAPGGMERQAARLAESFARRGRPVVLITNFFPKTRGVRLLGRHKLPELIERRRDGLVIYRIPYWSSLWFNYPTSQELLETLAAWILHRHAGSIDTIYAIQAQSGGVHATKLARVLERPTVLKLACSGEAGDIEMSRREPNAAQIFDCLKRLDRVVYLNEESREEALRSGVEPSRLVHVPNGIDLERFDRDVGPARLEELGPAEGRELLVFVGRLDRQKRAGVLLEAFARLASRRPRARLALLGDGPSRGELERRARELGLEGRAAFLGHRKDVPSVLRAASVFVLPSAQEGQSNALLEALAAGAPIVASDIAGNRAVVRHEREALLVPVDDPAALERALERLLDDRELALRLGRAGRARVEEEFSLDRVADRYLELFDALPRGPAPSLARFYARYVLSDLTGLTRLLLRGVVRDAILIAGIARATLTVAIVRVKRRLGIGDLLPPLFPARAQEREP